jgi:hypothetical protein
MAARIPGIESLKLVFKTGQIDLIGFVFGVNQVRQKGAKQVAAGVSEGNFFILNIRFLCAKGLKLGAFIQLSL